MYLDKSLMKQTINERLLEPSSKYDDLSHKACAGAFQQYGNCRSIDAGNSQPLAGRFQSAARYSLTNDTQHTNFPDRKNHT